MDFDVRGQHGMDFFTRGNDIMDYGLVFHPEVKNDGLVAYKHTDFHFTRHLIDGMESCVTVHTAGRDEEHADEEILQNNSL